MVILTKTNKTVYIVFQLFQGEDHNGGKGKQAGRRAEDSGRQIFKMLHVASATSLCLNAQTPQLESSLPPCRSKAGPGFAPGRGKGHQAKIPQVLTWSCFVGEVVLPFLSRWYIWRQGTSLWVPSPALGPQGQEPEDPSSQLTWLTLPWWEKHHHLQP